MNKLFWKNKRVLVTGHTGFKGGWLIHWLHRLGAKVSGLSQDPNTKPSLFETAELLNICNNYKGDIRDSNFVSGVIDAVKPQIVFHLAAQSLVKYGYDNPEETFSINTMGTVNLLNKLKASNCLKACIVVTTDKVYKNNEWEYPYRENDALGGYDPYSASKAACDLITDCFKQSYFAQKNIGLATARAGNVIGGGDWAKGRIIPDAIISWNKNEIINIRNPDAVRPWQHVLEPLYGYLQLAEKLWEKPILSGAYNFGPNTSENISVQQLVNLARIKYGINSNKVNYINNDNAIHETNKLTLEIAKVRLILGVKPIWDINESIEKTVHWYKNFYNGMEAYRLCDIDIETYEKMLNPL